MSALETMLQQQQEDVVDIGANLDITKIVNSTGPIVNAVLLKCGPSKTIEDIKMDTTPKKQMSLQILGGPFTFLGQYEDEGIVLMIRKQEELSETKELSINEHKLQPPFDDTEIRGDILIVKVAPESQQQQQEGTEKNVTNTNKENIENDNSGNDDNDDVDKKPSAAAAASIDSHLSGQKRKSGSSNDDTNNTSSEEEFFLNYTKDEYEKFASRTDVVAPTVPEDAEEDLVEDMEEEEEEEEDDDDESVEGEEDDEDDDDEDGNPMVDMLMGHVIKRFQDENGRLPDEEELNNLKSVVEQKLGGGAGLLGGMMGGEEEEEEEEEAVDEETKATASTVQECEG